MAQSWEQFAGASREHLAARAAAAREIVAPGSWRDRMAKSWAAMSERERAFWLKCSGLDGARGSMAWDRLSGDERAVIRNNLFRAARRASEILAGGISG